MPRVTLGVFGTGLAADARLTRSDSWIILRTSSRFGSNPIARIATLSSSASMVPESSVSNSCGGKHRGTSASGNRSPPEATNAP